MIGEGRIFRVKSGLKDKEGLVVLLDCIEVYDTYPFVIRHFPIVIPNSRILAESQKRIIMKDYKTVFVEATEVKQKKGFLQSSIMGVNGDDLARNIQAVIREMTAEGYSLKSSETIQSTKVYMSSYPYSFTSGVILIFERNFAAQ